MEIDVQDNRSLVIHVLTAEATPVSSVQAQARDIPCEGSKLFYVIE
jgi:hypothetical protein